MASPVKTSETKMSSSSSGGAMHIVGNVVGAILILGLGVFGLVFFGRKPEVPTDASKQNSSAVAPLVDTAEVKLWDQPFHLDVDGEAATYRVLTVGAEVTGRVKWKSEMARSGTFVNKGDVLFEIDPVNYELDKQRLQARVNQAVEELQAIEVDLESAAALLKLAAEENKLQQNHLERIGQAYAKKAASESDMDDATRQELTSRNAMQTQQNQFNSLTQMKKTKEAGLKLAQAELERTLVDLQRCQVVSPITGRVVDDVIEEGDYVKPGDPLVHVSDSARMEIKCSLKGQELAWIWQHGQQMDAPLMETSESAGSVAPGADDKQADPFKMPRVPCEIAFEFEGVETIWDGFLSRYEGTGMDRATRMFPCRVIVDAPEKTRVKARDGAPGVSPPTLLSGMYVTVRFPIESAVPLLEVPAESVRPGQQLWVVRNGVLQIVSVLLVRVDGGSALVRQEGGALRAGDLVVVSPLASVRDGMPVSLNSESPDGAEKSSGHSDASAPAVDLETMRQTDPATITTQEVKP